MTNIYTFAIIYLLLGLISSLSVYNNLVDEYNQGDLELHDDDNKVLDTKNTWIFFILYSAFYCIFWLPLDMIFALSVLTDVIKRFFKGEDDNNNNLAV